MAMLTGTGPASWAGVRKGLTASGGAIHLRSMIVRELSAAQLKQLASSLRFLNLSLSIEGGGYMCRPNGTELAAQQLQALQPFLAAGGRVAFWAIESVFSRTRQGCPGMSLDETVQQVASFAEGLASGLSGTRFFLYDALPHYSVGKAWPPNAPPPARAWAMDLPTVLSSLRAAMASRGVALEGYWADCPEDYSVTYPPAPGRGYERLAAAMKAVHGLGLAFGKTFNSQSGGLSTDEGFYTGTLADWKGAAAALDTSGLFMAMVETWYTHPSKPVPEAEPYTTSFTLSAVMREAAA